MIAVRRPQRSFGSFSKMRVGRALLGAKPRANAKVEGLAKLVAKV